MATTDSDGFVDSAVTAVPPFALVTGASSGIGFELAKKLRDHGWRLGLNGRDKGRLQLTAQKLDMTMDGREPPCLLFAQDLSRPGSAEALADMVTETLRGRVPDALINNAGFGEFGPFAECDMDGMRRMLELNIISLTTLTRAMLPGMIRRGSGSIMNVASTAAFGPGPLMATYYASKAYVLSFSDALSEELAAQGSKVTVTCLCPGPTRTEFQKRAGVKFAEAARSVVMDAATVAEAGYQGMLDGRRTVIPGFRNKLLTTGARLAPRGLVAKVIRRMQESKAPEEKK